MTGVANARSYPQYVAGRDRLGIPVYRVKTHEDQGHDTKVAPSADTARRCARFHGSRGKDSPRACRPDAARARRSRGKPIHTCPGTPGLLLTMDDILKLPKHELVTQFKCIEGWSQIVHWGGVRMADLMAAYPPEKGPEGKLPRYVYMETPNGDYYVGYDMKSASIRRRCW